MNCKLDIVVSNFSLLSAVFNLVSSALTRAWIWSTPVNSVSPEDSNLAILFSIVSFWRFNLFIFSCTAKFCNAIFALAKSSLSCSVDLDIAASSNTSSLSLKADIAAWTCTEFSPSNLLSFSKSSKSLDSANCFTCSSVKFVALLALSNWALVFFTFKSTDADSNLIIFAVLSAVTFWLFAKIFETFDISCNSDLILIVICCCRKNLSSMSFKTFRYPSPVVVVSANVSRSSWVIIALKAWFSFNSFA